MLSALIVAAAIQAAPQPAAKVAESMRLCSQRAVCSFVVAYPAERLMFAETVGPKPPLRAGVLCQGGWVDEAHKGSSGAEILIQAADGSWARHWTPLAPSQCHEFHKTLNIRLRTGDGQSAWHAIYRQSIH